MVDSRSAAAPHVAALGKDVKLDIAHREMIEIFTDHPECPTGPALPARLPAEVMRYDLAFGNGHITLAPKRLNRNETRTNCRIRQVAAHLMTTYMWVFAIAVNM